MPVTTMNSCRLGVRCARCSLTASPAFWCCPGYANLAARDAGPPRATNCRRREPSCGFANSVCSAPLWRGA